MEKEEAGAQMMANTRILSKPAERCQAEFNTETNVWNIAEGDNWSNITLTGTDMLGWHQTLDLSAMEVQDKTLFFSGQGILEVGDWTSTASNLIGLTCMEIVSEVPLDIDAMASDMSNQIFPGNKGSEIAWENIIVGRYRYLTPFTNQAAAAVGISYPFTARSQEFGAGEPTASSMLYLYVIVGIDVQGVSPDGVLKIPSRRFVLSGLPVKEPELEYMMRLARSTVVSNPEFE